ncbi:hypothetical protein ACX80S_16685 [Arthrobacter sp. RHLT1-20]
MSNVANPWQRMTNSREIAKSVEPFPVAFNDEGTASTAISRRQESHAVPPAVLHEQVSERKFRTGRNRRSI